ncbi:hypothetical protein GGP69_002111 [Salinibacter ruber]|nr:hypothetical protein [Salinibacter ruber]
MQLSDPLFPPDAMCMHAAAQPNGVPVPSVNCFHPPPLQSPVVDGVLITLASD